MLNIIMMNVQDPVATGQAAKMMRECNKVSVGEMAEVLGMRLQFYRAMEAGARNWSKAQVRKFNAYLRRAAG